MTDFGVTATTLRLDARPVLVNPTVDTDSFGDSCVSLVFRIRDHEEVGMHILGFSSQLFVGKRRFCFVL